MPPQQGHFLVLSIDTLPENKKRPASCSQETKRLQTLCGTTLIAAPLARRDPSRPPSRADAVTGIHRPYLLTRSLSERFVFRKGRRATGTPARLMEDFARVPRYQNRTESNFEKSFDRAVFQQEAPR